MFAIRRIHDDLLDANRRALDQVQRIFAERFPDAPQSDIRELTPHMRNPLARRFRTVLYVAENQTGVVHGFALVLHEPLLHMAYLDYIATPSRMTRRGIGGALYARLRGDCERLGARALFFECLPDGAEDCPDPGLRRQNAARLRFYEAYGARPLINNDYTAPISAESEMMPYIVADDFGRTGALSRGFVREAVRAVLERKYYDICPAGYVDHVVESFRDDPVLQREPRYERSAAPVSAAPSISRAERIAVFVNDKHEIHHVHDRGYVEAPVRVGRILSELERSELIDLRRPRSHGIEPLLEVHDRQLVSYMRKICLGIESGKSVYPYVFPIRNRNRPPADLSVTAGYWCIDTFTPLSRSAFLAARRAVDCALSAAGAIAAGHRLAYALVRPPGHHAERRVFGGFCYFNSTAAAAQFLSRLGPVAILDLDYHHGNGQQDIFYSRNDVLTVSIHGHPRFAYPYFSGHADEEGEGAGKGYNLNLPLPEHVDGERYRQALKRALRRLVNHSPTTVVVALGLDTAKGDPTGTWSLNQRDMYENGLLVGRAGLPVLVVQEGGYRTKTLGINARSFFEGLSRGALES